MVNPVQFAATGSNQPTTKQHHGDYVCLQSLQPDAAASQRTGTGQGLQMLSVMPGEQLVRLTLANQAGQSLQLWLHPDNARALLLSQQHSALEQDDVVQVPAQAQWREANGGQSQRSLLGDVFFKSMDLFGLSTKKQLATLTALKVGKLLDAQVNEGVYLLSKAPISSLKQQQPTVVAAVPDPVLVLIHGTFVDTASSFGLWWKGREQLAAELFKTYKNQVYALDHATVLRSPLQNALTLVNALPPGAVVHLVTHSRGGLVAECLVRATQPLTAADLALFADVEYQQHRADLQQLVEQVQAKNIRVERVVRAACPAHGTLLASDRLDSYLSVLIWLLEQSNIPVVAELLDFVKAVARERTDPKTLAGIEAMRFDSPVIKWLNRPAALASNSQLRVIAGDIEAGSLFSWVKVLLADSFYRCENDLVVQTSAMYGGVLRTDARFLLERGSKTNHFNYFANLSTANAMLDALKQANAAGFKQIGPLSQQGNDPSGSRGYHPNILQPDVLGSADKPLVLVLPGITGSHLKRGSQREWLAIHRAFGLLDSIAIDTPEISPDGLIEAYYQDLLEQLAEHYEVLPFAFDWRLSLKDSAQKLAVLLQKQLSYRGVQPIHLVAHSMGSQVFRVLQLEHNDLWQQWLQRKQTRIVLLGPPNQGSWAPLMMLTGDDVMAKVLSGLAGDFDTLKTRQQIARFQGLLEMQAGLLDSRYLLSALSNWQRLADADQQVAERRNPWFSRISQAHIWAKPTQLQLNEMVQLRAQLDAQHPELQKYKDKISIILGSSDETPCGLVQDTLRGVEFEFTKAGDGRVTWDNAIIDELPCWLSKAEHGDLANDKDVIGACLQLLAQQPVRQSRGLTPFYRQQRGAAHPEHSSWRKPRQSGQLWLGGLQLANTQALAQTLSRSGLTVQSIGSELPRLQIEVNNGDLRFIRQPLLLGHQIAMELTGSEFVVDQMLGGDLTQALSCGVYPVQPGQYQVFQNRQVNEADPLAFPKPKAAIVVGLGDEGELTPAVIQQAVCAGVVGYCLQLAQPAQGIELAATTLGSGGILTVSQSVEALVQGVLSANQKLIQLSGGRATGWITKLVVVEQFHNRALEAWRKLHACQTLSRSMTIDLAPQVSLGHGAISRPAEGHYRGAKYDFIRITERPLDAEYLLLEFALFTRRARSEIYYKRLQKAQIEQLLHNAQSTDSFDRELARTLFQLIFPHELKGALRTAGDLVLELDAQTARYPWEMLDDRDEFQWQAGEKTWALAGEGALLRKFRTASFRRQPAAAMSNAVLVIGEPRSAAPPLPGAVDEACRVAGMFGQTAKLLLHASSSEVFKAALASAWQVIHLAGHGIYQPATALSAGKAGLVLENGIVFGPTEFESMEAVPELVVVNCCELGKVDGMPPALFPEFAANVAEQLIRNGVRCVIAAGWAVGDKAAAEFATTFYEALNEGLPFGTAVQLGRQAAFDADSSGNTWSAYQCYGEPGWRLGSQHSTRALKKEQLMASASELLITLEVLKNAATGAAPARKEELVNELQILLRYQPADWLAQGRVAEAIAQVWHKLNANTETLRWYQLAVAAADGSASFVAYQQQLNLTARLKQQEQQALLEVVEQLKQLQLVAETSERSCLLGSAYKRLVMQADRDQDSEAQQHYLTEMAKAYQTGAELPCDNLYYPLWNQYLARLRLSWLAGAGKTTLPDAADWQQLLLMLQQNAKTSPDFWNHVGQIEWRICTAMLAQQLSTQLPELKQRLMDLQLLVNNTSYWGSVYDNATFLLPYYQANAAVAEQERQAAQSLLDLLRQFCA